MKKILFILLMFCFVAASAQVNRPSAGGMTDPMTTRGDAIIKDATNTTARLAVGTAGQVLTTDGTDLSWSSPTVGTVTSVGLTTPIGLDVLGSPITAAGTFALTMTAGYSIPTDVEQAVWDTYDSSYFDLTGNRITTKTAVDEIATDTMRTDYLAANTIGAGSYDGNFGTLYADTNYAGIDTAATMPNGVMVADSATGQVYWIDADSVGNNLWTLLTGDLYPSTAGNNVWLKDSVYMTNLPYKVCDTILGISNDTIFEMVNSAASDWTRSGGDIYPTTATDDIWGKDTIKVGESGGTTGVIELIASDGDIGHIYMHTTDRMMFRSANSFDLGGIMVLDASTIKCSFGSSNSLTQNFSTVIGSDGRTASRGQLAHAYGRFSVDGDAQDSRYITRRSVTHADATWYTLFTDGSSLTVDVPASGVWFFRADIVATNTTQDTTMAYTITGHIKRDASNNTTMMGTPTITTHYETNANYLVQAVADDVNEALAIQVQLTSGSDGSGVRQWVSRIKWVQVIF
jgi:hypothetical protein